MSNLIMEMINNNITVEHFSEYERDISGGHHRQEEMKARVPP